MKKIEAIIKPFLLEEVKDGLQEIGIVGITVSEIKNFRPAAEAGAGGARPPLGAAFVARAVSAPTPMEGGFGSTEFSPRLKLEVVVPDVDFDAAVTCIRERGKIRSEFSDELIAQTLQDVVRIRTDEHGEAAI